MTTISANRLAILIPFALLAAAWSVQLIDGLQPCEMCHWQRWALYAALGTALVASGAGRLGRRLDALAAVLIACSGAIGAYHAGVEAHLWGGLTACTSSIVMHGTTAAERLAEIMRAPLIRCDVVRWRFAGLSMAAWNAILCAIGAGAVATAPLRGGIPIGARRRHAPATSAR